MGHSEASGLEATLSYREQSREHSREHTGRSRRDARGGRLRAVAPRHVGLLAVLVGIAITLGVSPAAAQTRPGAPARTQEISITDSGFDPPSVEVATGTAVVWTNSGTRTHDVTSSTGLFQSGLMSPGQSYTYLFDTAGRYSFSSASDTGITGEISVTGVTASSDPTAPPAAADNPTAPTPGQSVGAPDAFAVTGPAESIALALLGTAVVLFGWALVVGNRGGLAPFEPWRILALVDPRRAGFTDELLPRGRWRRAPRRSTQANLLPRRAWASAPARGAATPVRRRSAARPRSRPPGTRRRD